MNIQTKENKTKKKKKNVMGREKGGNIHDFGIVFGGQQGVQGKE